MSAFHNVVHSTSLLFKRSEKLLELLCPASQFRKGIRINSSKS
jgi:hypothetical protein